MLRTKTGLFRRWLAILRPGWRRGLMACVAAVALAGAVSASVPSAALAAEDEEEESIETKFIKGLFGINDRDSINYRERPPLVVPPNLEPLPQPEANAVTNTPSWPKDPEARRTQEARPSLKKTPRRKTSEDDDRALTPAELDAHGRKAAGSTVLNPTGPQDAESDSCASAAAG